MIMFGDAKSGMQNYPLLIPRELSSSRFKAAPARPQNAVCFSQAFQAIAGGLEPEACKKRKSYPEACG
jgi:hypothetical protein